MVLFPVSYTQVQQEEQAVAERLASFGLRRVPMPGDGNCQFRALATFFADPRVSHVTLRRLVARFVWQHRERFRPYIAHEYGIDVRKYCQRMQRDGEWGDAISLQAFGVLFRINVWLFMPSGVTSLHDYEDGLNVALVHRGNHYDAATAIDPADADAPLTM